MSTSGTVVIFIEFPVWRWRFDLVLNASVMSASAAMRVYIFHDRPFQVPITSPLFEHISHTVRLPWPYFQPPRYPTDGDSDSDTRLTPTASLDSNPSELSYPSYHVETDLFEPSYPSVIHLTFDSSSSSATPRHTSPPVRGHRFIHTRVVPRGCGRARGGGHGDVTPGGFRNGYLPPDE